MGIGQGIVQSTRQNSNVCSMSIQWFVGAIRRRRDDVNNHHLVTIITFNNQHLYASPALCRHCFVIGLARRGLGIDWPLGRRGLGRRGLSLVGHWEGIVWHCGRGEQISVVKGELNNNMMIIQAVPPPADRPYISMFIQCQFNVFTH